MKNRSKSVFENEKVEPNNELVDALKESLSVLIQIGIEALSDKLTKRLVPRRQTARVSIKFVVTNKKRELCIDKQRDYW